jgi:hypothetical protein
MANHVSDEDLTKRLGITLEELTQWRDSIAEHSVPIVLRTMLNRGLIDLDRTHDERYLWHVVMANLRDMLPYFQAVVEIQYDFLEVAQQAMDAGKPMVAVVLVATAVEQLINMYYRDLLCARGLPEPEITEIIRSNIDPKLGWLFSLTGHFEFPGDLKKRIRALMSLRNEIIHYKAVPFSPVADDNSHRHIEEQIRSIRGVLLSIPSELEDTFDVALEKVIPNCRLASELADLMLHHTA